MIYNSENSIAYHVLSQIGTWIKDDGISHVFEIEIQLENINKIFHVTIDCEENNVTGIYNKNDISENLISEEGHFDQDIDNEYIYWLDFGQYVARIELELEFIQISVYHVVSDEETIPLYSKSFNWKE